MSVTARYITARLEAARLWSRLLPCAWTRDDWMLRYVGRIPESVVELYPRMSEQIIDYIREVGHLT